MLWWGKFDPDYSRNRLIRHLFAQLGFRLTEFRPRISALGDWEARLRRPSLPALVWVPCFRHRDVLAARRWCDRLKVPLVFDPLISGYDKQVFERLKFAPDSIRAERLRSRESRLFCAADVLLADTGEHADFYQRVLHVPLDRLAVVPVGAEEGLFCPAPGPEQPNSPVRVLFYGSFLPLHGMTVIARAIREYAGPPVQWQIIGDGPLRSEFEAIVKDSPRVQMETWVDYRRLPERIRQADIVLGIFGPTQKAARVIPNKAFQTLACGRPLITRSSPAYPRELQETLSSGIFWVPPDDATALAKTIAALAADPSARANASQAARRTFESFFSERQIAESLRVAIHKAGL